MKKERIVTTIICGLAGVIGAIGLGNLGAIILPAVFVALELIFVKLEVNMPKWKIVPFAFYIISAILGGLIFEFFRIGESNPKSMAAILILTPAFWFIYDLFNPDDCE